MQHALYSAGESDCCIAILHIEAHSVKTAAMTIIITLCAYAQQGYAFGHVGLCICVYICGQKKWLFEVVLLEYLSLV